jgi:hypothetical protein
MLDVKHCTWQFLQDSRTITRMQDQVLAYSQHPEYRVMLEFVRTKSDPIPLSPTQIADHLRLASRGVDLTRVSIRIINDMTDPADIVFQALQVMP